MSDVQFLTLDRLIERLQKLREAHGGDCLVATLGYYQGSTYDELRCDLDEEVRAMSPEESEKTRNSYLGLRSSGSTQPVIRIGD